MTEIIIPAWAAHELTADAPADPNPHLIFHCGTINVITPDMWAGHLRPDGALLIMTRDDLAGVCPQAAGFTPGILAATLTLYASSLDPDPHLGVGGFTATAREIPGGFYVPGCLDGCLACPDPAPLRLLTPATCGHCTTICTDCAESWSLDWTLYWNQTPGGRLMRNQLILRTPLI